MNRNSEQEQSRMIDRTLNDLSFNRKAPKAGFIALVLLYFAATIAVTQISGMKGQISVGDVVLPYSAVTGVFSTVSNICVIMMAIFYRKLGYMTGVCLLLMQYPMMVASMVRQKAYGNLPGAFINMLTIVAISCVYVNNINMEKLQRHLQDQAITDSMTGLPNRFACSEMVRKLVEDEERFTFVSVDLNGFKSINDTLGFNSGNEVLKQITSRWAAIADSGESGTYDFIARLSGDEFALIIRRYASEQDIENTIRRYEKVLGERLTVDDCDLYISASFGYAEYPTDAATADKLGSYASAAMKEVKRINSSNHILKFTPELVREEHTLEIEQKLRTALENDTLFFHLQPQYDIQHKLRGFEALARMRDEHGDIISPGEFIPVAEKVGLIDSVDAAVIRKSAAFFGQLIQKTGADIILSVNVSVRHLMKNDFLKELEEILRESGVPAAQIEIEITESIMIDSVEKALNCIEGIRKMGMQIAIDDFGTGYSSLSYLNRFPAHLLKIDKSFIDRMNTNDSSKQYVASIISIGHILGFDVISEGVEEAEQVETLRSIGCDFIQGFIWGRPLSQEKAEEVVMQSIA